MLDRATPLTAEQPWPMPDRTACWFYHSMEFPDGEHVDGVWAIGDFQQYVGGVPVAGKSVLDIGTASGFLAFGAERAGAAEVSALDVREVRELNMIPFAAHGLNTVSDRRAYERDAEVKTNQMKSGYWYAWHKYSSKVETIYAPHSDLRYWDRRFDVVIAGAIIEHLAEPIELLGQACRLARETVIIAFTPITNEDDIVMRASHPWTDSASHWAWWTLSRGLYTRLFENMGFSIEIVPAKAFSVTHDREFERCTIVARRTR